MKVTVNPVAPTEKQYTITIYLGQEDLDRLHVAVEPNNVSYPLCPNLQKAEGRLQTLAILKDALWPYVNQLCK